MAITSYKDKVYNTYTLMFTKYDAMNTDAKNIKTKNYKIILIKSIKYITKYF